MQCWCMKKEDLGIETYTLKNMCSFERSHRQELGRGGERERRVERERKYLE